jgi:hypothetical protein
MTIETFADLSCHPATPCEAIDSIRVAVRRTDTQLELSFRLNGNIPGICLTPPSSYQSLIKLWRHTCFELFVAIEGLAAYHEFNFAPTWQWCVYAFRAYRDLDTAVLTLRMQSPIIGVKTAKQSLELDARITLADLSPIHPDSPLRLGLSTVIEQVHGPLSYWALSNPAGKPDFHHAEAFALRIEVPRTEP